MNNDFFDYDEYYCSKYKSANLNNIEINPILIILFCSYLLQTKDTDLDIFR